MSRCGQMRMVGACIVITVVTITAGAQADRVREYVSLALQGNLAPAAALFAGDLTPEEEELAARFRRRFIDRNEEWADSLASPFVRDVMTAYRTYWTKSLLGELTEPAGEAFLEAELRQVLATHGHREEVPDREVTRRVGKEIERQGLYVLGGVTRPYFDLMLWAQQDTTHYEVELTDTTQPVTVIFIGDFLIKGWSHFATFGRAYTGGWAAKEALFCLREDYDLESEKFRISYLKHESRHFADYTLYPALEQTDLEYRAKLTELIYARESLYDLLEHFAGSSEANPNAPHAHANFVVVRDLSRLLLGEGGTEARSLRSVAVERINEAAAELLVAHSRRLVAAGADTTRGVIQSP